MKKIIVLAVCAALTLLASLTASAYTKVYIDETEVSFNESTGYPFVENGRTLVPLRVTMETFGAEVDWEQATKTAYVRKGTTTVRCVVGENSIYRNNVRISNDAVAVITGGKTYLPIRAVLEAFGATVGWSGSVLVESGSAVPFINKVKTTPSVTRNYWAKWTEALELKSQGKYEQAAQTIMSVSNVFLEVNSSNSNAMLFKHLGECYAALGDYEKASACFKQEALYWEASDGMEQSVIDANRRAKLISVNQQVYVKSSDNSLGASSYFGVKHEPVSGILLGSYAESDKLLHNPWNPNLFYMDTFPKLVEKDMAAYLLYLTYGMDISTYQSHIKRARENDVILQISLEPLDGLQVVKENDPYLISLAKNMESADCGLMLRFAGEMNDVTSRWYEKNPKVFIEKFRIVASVFHKYAPSVPVVWAPNFYPEDNIDDYYPGDEYVDYVGISSYKRYSAVTDPLGKGIDRGRWSNQLDRFYSTYGHRKPIVIVEGNASCTEYENGKDRTDFACSQLNDFYTYLPIKYPNIKMNFIFACDRLPNRYALSNNEKFLNTYKNSIKQACYLSDVNDSNNDYDYYEIGNNVVVKAEKTQLCSYVTSPNNDVAYVTYSINGESAGVAYGIPYKVSADFSEYKGEKVTVSVSSYNAEHKRLAKTDITVNVI